MSKSPPSPTFLLTGCQFNKSVSWHGTTSVFKILSGWTLSVSRYCSFLIKLHMWESFWIYLLFWSNCESAFIRTPLLFSNRQMHKSRKTNTCMVLGFMNVYGISGWYRGLIQCDGMYPFAWLSIIRWTPHQGAIIMPAPWGATVPHPLRNPVSCVKCHGSLLMLHRPQLRNGKQQRWTKIFLQGESTV